MTSNPSRRQCEGCHRKAVLAPFWIFTDADYWWVNRGNLINLCPNCHTARAAIRNAEPDKLPAWWFVASRLAAYIPPEPPEPILELRQASLL